MDSSEYIEAQMKRYMARVLEEVETIENPLRAGASTASVVAEIPEVKRRIRKHLLKFAGDCVRVADPNTVINAYEPIRSSR